MSDENQTEELEPPYECDYDYPCRCLQDGVEGEWFWYPTENCWRCSGCGETQ